MGRSELVLVTNMILIKSTGDVSSTYFTWKLNEFCGFKGLMNAASEIVSQRFHRFNILRAELIIIIMHF